MSESIQKPKRVYKKKQIEQPKEEIIISPVQDQKPEQKPARKESMKKKLLK